MSEDSLLEITRNELGTLKEFLHVLKEERDAIISFSLEGVMRENSRKEALLRKLEDLENRREALLKDNSGLSSTVDCGEMTVLRSDIRITLDEAKKVLAKNMGLLSFSMDHVQSSIQNIVRFLNRTTYGGTRNGRISLVLSKEV